MKLIFPAILIIAAIGLFVAYTNPTYQSIQALSAENSSYDDALNKSQELKSTRDQLLSKYDTFSSSDLQKLQEVLPDNVDNIRLIIDINNIAARHGLTLSDVSVGDVVAGSGASADTSGLSVGQQSGAVGSVDISFSVSADYPSFLAFLDDLEHSLRVVDVDKLSFTAPQDSTSATVYSLDIRTYWLH